jgi:hypothetical protein
MGDEVIGTCRRCNTPRCKSGKRVFVKKYVLARQGARTIGFNYTTAQMIHEVIKANNGNFRPGGRRVMIKIDRSAVGQHDEMRNPVEHLHQERKCEDVRNDKTSNTVIETRERQPVRAVQQGQFPRRRSTTAIATCPQILNQQTAAGVCSGVRSLNAKAGMSVTGTRSAANLSLSSTLSKSLGLCARRHAHHASTARPSSVRTEQDDC